LLFTAPRRPAVVAAPMSDASAIPEVSVVMPVYNAHGWLARSIGSLRAQTFAGWELLAVDDC
jgi:hypothetical protein